MIRAKDDAAVLIHAGQRLARLVRDGVGVVVHRLIELHAQPQAVKRRGFVRRDDRPVVIGEGDALDRRRPILGGGGLDGDQNVLLDRLIRDRRLAPDRVQERRKVRSAAVDLDGLVLVYVVRNVLGRADVDPAGLVDIARVGVAAQSAVVIVALPRREALHHGVLHGFGRVHEGEDTAARRGELGARVVAHRGVPRAQRHGRAAVFQDGEVVAVADERRRHAVKLVARDLGLVGDVFVLIPFQLLVVQLAVEADAALDHAVEQAAAVKLRRAAERLELGDGVLEGDRPALEQLADALDARERRLAQNAQLLELLHGAAVFDRAERRVHDRKLEAPVHADGDDLAAIQRHAVHRVAEREVRLRVRARVVGAVRNVRADVLVVLVGERVPAVEVVHRDGDAVQIRGEQQVDVPVVKLHGIVVARQQLQIADDLVAAELLLDDHPAPHRGDARYAERDCGAARSDRVDDARVVRPRHVGIVGHGCKPQKAQVIRLADVQMNLAEILLGVQARGVSRRRQQRREHRQAEQDGGKSGLHLVAHGCLVVHLPNPLVSKSIGSVISESPPASRTARSRQISPNPPDRETPAPQRNGAAVPPRRTWRADRSPRRADDGGDGQKGHRLRLHDHAHIQGDGRGDRQGDGDGDQLLQPSRLPAAADRPRKELQQQQPADEGAGKPQRAPPREKGLLIDLKAELGHGGS